ncbi:MAG: selenide, water dikinase SelD [Rhodobacter sp.]|nr:selenide, water dikinase SelD [Rhodobacter sp.]
MTPLPLTRDLVLIGGGHTHALVLRRWGMAPLPGTRLTLVNPGPTAPYTGMLPGLVAGHYQRDDLEIDLVKLARFAGARLILGEVCGLDRAARTVHVPGRPPVPFDIASINIGITSDLPRLPGFAEHATAAKPLGPYAARWQDFRTRVARGTPPQIAVIGAGVGGVELSMAMAHALRSDGHDPQITVIDKAGALPGLAPRARAALRDHLARLGVALCEHVSPAEITAETVRLDDGAEIPARFTVGTAGARPHAWLAETGLDLTNGFVTVDPMLRSTNDSAVYAAGDCAHLAHAPRVKAGVFAVRQAPVLFHNLRADLAGRARRRFHPQRDYLKLISLGGRSALADKFGLAFQGPRLWTWKDRIDRRFMARFQRLPAMQPAAVPREATQGLRHALGEKPLCGGCGAKVGGGTLQSVLATLPQLHRPDVETRPGDDAAVLRMGDTRQVLTTDHLRAFTDDPYTLARVAAVHAMGDIWAMGANPQAALATVILPRMTAKMQKAWLAEIMDAARTAFAEAGVEIAGGHTSIGSELTVGFTVTGICGRAPITLGGARPGDALILTKPIGSGTILAAEMALAAGGDWVASALAHMAVPQGKAMTILSAAHAMTDVTGFGLAGHLHNLCAASGTAAELDLAAVPVMTGAESLAAAGIRSSLYPENRAYASQVEARDGPRTDLLFDPQTAGGLLAAVASDDAEQLLENLLNDGFSAARIGQLTDGPAKITVI